MDPLVSKFQLEIPFAGSNKLIRQHNDITAARYNLTAVEKDIIYLILQSIKESDSENKVYRFPVSSLKSQVREELNHKNIKEAAHKLLSRVYEIRKPTGWLKISPVSSIEYVENEGIIELKIDSKLRPYLFNIRNNFTTFWSKTAMNLRSKYAKRFYEMLSRYKDTGHMRISLMKLKETLYLLNSETGEEKYIKWSRFHDKVIKPAKKELDEKADIKFNYTPIRSGKKYTHIEFEIIKEGVTNNNSKSLNDDEKVKCFKRLVQENKLSVWQARAVLENIPIKDISKILYEIKLQKINNNVKSIGGYTFKIFTHKYPNLFTKSE